MLRSFDAHAIDKLAPVYLCLAETNAGKLSRAHSDSLGKLFNREIFAKILQCPNLQLSQRSGGHSLTGEHVTVLRLPTWAYEEHDQKSCNIQCSLMSQIFFNKRQRKIDTCSDTSRGIYGAIFR